jgi:acetylornithine aminotransferase
VLRLAPPLIVTDAQLDTFVAALPSLISQSLPEPDEGHR